jgi:hypothetical protein
MTDKQLLKLSESLEDSIIDHVVAEGSTILVYRRPALPVTPHKTIDEIESAIRKVLTKFPAPDEYQLATMEGSLRIKIIACEPETYDRLDKYKDNDAIVEEFLSRMALSTPSVAGDFLINNIKSLDEKTQSAVIFLAFQNALNEQTGKA